jgi:hypothetical protein
MRSATVNLVNVDEVTWQILRAPVGEELALVLAASRE